MGSVELQIFVSLFVILGAAFVALLCDFLKGNNERLRERNIELQTRHEERDKREQLLEMAQRQAWNAAVQAQETAALQAIQRVEEPPPPALAPVVETVQVEAAPAPAEPAVNLEEHAKPGTPIDDVRSKGQRTPSMPAAIPGEVQSPIAPRTWSTWRFKQPSLKPTGAAFPPPIALEPGAQAEAVLVFKPNGVLLPTGPKPQHQRSIGRTPLLPVKLTEGTQPANISIWPAEVLVADVRQVSFALPVSSRVAGLAYAERVPVPVSPAAGATTVRAFLLAPWFQAVDPTVPSLKPDWVSGFVETGDVFQLPLPTPAEPPVQLAAGQPASFSSTPPSPILPAAARRPATPALYFAGSLTLPPAYAPSEFKLASATVSVLPSGTAPVLGFQTLVVGETDIKRRGELAPLDQPAPALPAGARIDARVESWPVSDVRMPAMPQALPGAEPDQGELASLAGSSIAGAPFHRASPDRRITPEQSGVALPGTGLTTYHPLMDHGAGRFLPCSPLANTTVFRQPQEPVAAFTTEIQYPRMSPAAATAGLSLGAKTHMVLAPIPADQSPATPGSLIPIEVTFADTTMPLPSAGTGLQLRPATTQRPVGLPPVVKQALRGGPHVFGALWTASTPETPVFPKPEAKLPAIVEPGSLPIYDPAFVRPAIQQPRSSAIPCITLDEPALPSSQSRLLPNEWEETPTQPVAAEPLPGVASTFRSLIDLRPEGDICSSDVPVSGLLPEVQPPTVPTGGEVLDEPVVRIRVVRDEDLHPVEQTGPVSPGPFDFFRVTQRQFDIEECQAVPSIEHSPSLPEDAMAFEGDFAPEPVSLQKSRPRRAPILVMPAFDDLRTLFYPNAPGIDRLPEMRSNVVQMPESRAEARETLPSGLQHAEALERALRRTEAFHGILMVVTLADYENTLRQHGAAVVSPVLDTAAQLLATAAGREAFLCSPADGEFVLIWPQDRNGSTQRPVNSVTECLWDFQLRTLGGVPILFSWGVADANGDSLAETIATARQRMLDSRRHRRAATTGAGRFRRLAVS